MSAMADGLKERENLYKLMISQLRYDGFESIASTLAKVVNIISACPPMARLHQVVNLGIQAETEGTRPEQPAIPGLTPTVETNRGIDLEYEPEGNELSGEWQSSTADESFMSNLELQKVDQESKSEPEDKPGDSPSPNMVLHHIIRITSDKKLADPFQDPKPIQASNPLTLNGNLVDAESICEQVKIELVKYNVSQEVFAKAVLGKSQGYLSEMLKHGESFFRPQDHTHYKGWMNFETMRQFLLKPEAERLRIYYEKGEELKMERLKRRQIEIGLTDDSSKKKRRLIPTEAKAVMEDYYNRNKYLSIEKRQTLANELAIPEQCVSDYFKNLRSRKKHEERMKCLLKGLESGDKELDKIDSEPDESSFENGVNHQLPSCSRSIPVVTMSLPVTGETSIQVKPSSLIRHCGRRYNVTPAVTMASFQTQRQPAKSASEPDLVASKIVALTQNRRATVTHKQPVAEEVRLAAKTSGHHDGVTFVRQEVTPSPTSTPRHYAAQEDVRHDRNYLLSQESASGVDAVETLTFDSLIDGSMMLQGGTPDSEALEVGQHIYVVHLNNHMETSVRN